MSNKCLYHLMTCTVYKEQVKELTLKLVAIDFMDRVERWSSIFGNFHIAVIGVDEPLTLSLNINGGGGGGGGGGYT